MTTYLPKHLPMSLVVSVLPVPDRSQNLHKKLAIQYFKPHTCRAGWGSAHRHSQCLSQRDVAAIGEGSYDQSLCTAKELILIDEVDVGDTHQTVVSLLYEIEPALFEPLKVRGHFDVHPHLIIMNIVNIISTS